MRNAALSLFLLGILTGCNEETTPPQIIRDVPYFLSHPEELQLKFAECKDNPGLLSSDPECVNASAANKARILEEARRALRGQ